MLPQYEISDIIGRGGMGAVYRGRQISLERDVAIKLLPETFTKGEDELNFVARFKQEARAMAKFDHPAILSVYDFGETADGQLYFVMEFVDGMDVHQYLQHHGGKLPQESALTITAHVLDALDYAHSHGIAHRDIKPANILLNHEGRVKIADFGLAKKFGEHANASTPALTLANVAVGTPAFVAPEALDSDQIPDHRADLYAVGVMLYQMLTGKLPRGNFQWPSEFDAEIDERLDDIVSKAMESNPDHRYQSAAAVRADLDLVLSQPLARVEPGEPSSVVAAAVPVTTSVRGGRAVKSGSKVPVVLGLAAAVVMVAGLIVMATKGNRSTGFQPVPSTDAASAKKRVEQSERPSLPNLTSRPPKTRARCGRPPRPCHRNKQVPSASCRWLRRRKPPSRPRRRLLPNPIRSLPKHRPFQKKHPSRSPPPHRQPPHRQLPLPPTALRQPPIPSPRSPDSRVASTAT